MWLFFSCWKRRRMARACRHCRRIPLNRGEIFAVVARSLDFDYRSRIRVHGGNGVMYINEEYIQIHLTEYSVIKDLRGPMFSQHKDSAAFAKATYVQSTDVAWKLTNAQQLIMFRYVNVWERCVRVRVLTFNSCGNMRYFWRNTYAARDTVAR